MKLRPMTHLFAGIPAIWKPTHGSGVSAFWTNATILLMQSCFLTRAVISLKNGTHIFFAVRRGGREFMDEYADGTLSHFAKRIYDVIIENEALPVHAIKQIGGFSKEDNSKFDRALVDLQMKMYLTMCGRQQKLSKKGEEYGWSSTVFCTVERYFGKDIIDKADKINEKEAIEKITEQIYRLNPAAEPKKIIKFIKG